MQASIAIIAKRVNGVIVGDSHEIVHTLSPLDDIQPNSIVFADNEASLKIAENSNAVAILAGLNITSTIKPVIQVQHPYQAFIDLLTYFYPPARAPVGIHPSAIIEDHVTLGQNVSVGPFAVIGSGSSIGDNTIIKAHVTIGHQVTIGADCTLHPQVTLYDNCVLGDRVAIHAASVIGSDGFGYKFINGQHIKVPHVGIVRIEDDVEIGANTVVDKATLGATVIGRGTKIDNLVQVAHSVKLGQHNILCAFTGIAGSTTSGNHVVFAANVGVSDHVRIDDGVILGARAGVPPNKHLKEGQVYLGSPARPREKAIEQELSTARIPFISKRLKALTEKVNQLIKEKTTEGA